MTTEPEDWNRVAVEVADVARKHRREQPIGMYQSSEELRVAALFGNGETRYDDEDSTAQIAVELLRQRFDRLGVMEVGFGLDSEASSTWAMIVKVPGRVIDEHQLERFRQELQEAYRIAGEQEYGGPTGPAFLFVGGIVRPNEPSPAQSFGCLGSENTNIRFGSPNITSSPT